MADWIETQRGVVVETDCDVNRHMNVLGYFTRLGQSSGYLLSLAGLYYSDLVEQGYGLGSVINTTRYNRELLDGNRYVIESAFVRLGNSSIRYVHKMTNEGTGELSASSDTVEVLFDMTARASTPWPADMRARFEPMLVTLSGADREWFDGKSA